MEPIYQLSDFQVTSLHIACNGKVQAFVVLDSIPEDSPEIKEKFEMYKKGAEELIEQGLTRDVSDSFVSAILVTKEKHGRGSKVYAPTEAAFLMFHGMQNRTIN